MKTNKGTLPSPTRRVTHVTYKKCARRKRNAKCFIHKVAAQTTDVMNYAKDAVRDNCRMSAERASSQTGGQTDRQTCRQTGRQTGRRADRQACRRAGR